jgi:hypothetical protein
LVGSEERKEWVVAARTKVVKKMRMIRDLEVGDVVVICGVARRIDQIEPHQMDAFRILFTGERRWVRSVFDNLEVIDG